MLTCTAALPTEIEGIAEAGAEVTVQYRYLPGRPARMYMPNGDPGYPAEDTELELLSITVGDTDIELYLSERDHENLYDQVYDRAAEDLAEYNAEAAIDRAKPW